MPPKPAAPKAKAGAGKAAARRPSASKQPARPGSARPGSKKSTALNLPLLEIDTKVSNIPRRDLPTKIGGLEVWGQHGLPRPLLETILGLPFVQGHSKIYLHRISLYQRPQERPPPLAVSGSMRGGKSSAPPVPLHPAHTEESREEEADLPSLFVALCPESRPVLLRIGLAQILEEEVQDLPDFLEAYGHWCPDLTDPKIVGSRHKHSVMVVPLAGGRCLLPPLAREPMVEQITSFTQTFIEALRDDSDLPLTVSKALKATQHVCCSLLLQPMQHCTERVLNLTQVFTNLEDLMLGRTHPELGVDYFDGLGASGMVADQVDDFRGGPLSDGIPVQELNKMVFELVPGMKQTRPTQFLNWFHAQMQQSGNRWLLKAYYSDSPAPIEFDSVLQDEDGHAFILPFSANAQFYRLATLREGEELKHRHIFARLARWLLSGLLIFAPLESPADQKQLRELVLLLASMPEEDIGSMCPPPPPDGSLHMRFVWAFCRRVIRCFRWHTTMMIDGKLVSVPQPGLQMVWALLDAALECVCSEHSRSCPERKRLALFASVAFAVRLAAASRKMDEVPWMEKTRLWGRFDDGVDIEGLASHVYTSRFGVKEAWSKDPVTQEVRSIFRDDLPWEVIPLEEEDEDVKTVFPEDEEVTSVDAEKSEMRSEAEPSATMQAIKDVQDSMGHQARLAWEKSRRLLITGGIGTGKRSISRNILADLVLGQVCEGQVSRFPVRLTMSELQDQLGKGPDAVQQQALDPPTLGSCGWERLRPPSFGGRWGHQVIQVEKQVLVLGGCSTQNNKALQDAWISKDGGLTWEELPTPPWPGRSGHQVIWWEDRLILLGGLGDEDRRFRDSWQSTDVGMSWQELPCPKWPARFGHQALVMDLSVKAPPRPLLLLMGGSGTGNKALKDVWASDSGGFSWFELEPMPCSARWNFHLTNFQERLWLTGGCDDSHHFNDCWTLGGATWAPKGGGAALGRRKSAMDVGGIEPEGWKNFTAPWPARQGHQAVPFRGQLAIFGGCDEKGQVLSDAWLSEDGSAWQRLPYFAWAQAAGRAGHQVLLLEDGRSMIFGGLGGGRDILRSRLLALVIEDVDEDLQDEEDVVNYLDRLLKHEPGHLVLLVSSLRKLPDPQGFGLAATSATMTATLAVPDTDGADLLPLLKRWGFSELHVKPLEQQQLRALVHSWTSLEMRDKVETEMLMPDNYDLVNSPLTAMMVLHALAAKGRTQRHPLTRCQLYEHMFRRIFQSHQAVRAHDDSEFEALNKQGLPAACAELAYEALGRSSRCIKAHELAAFIGSSPKELTELLEKLVRTAHGGQILLLEDYLDGGLRFRYPSMQDYLAAKCAWQHLLEGRGLPPWLIQENAAGSVSEAVTSCAKFFCLQAEGKEPLKKELLLELREGLAFLLQTMCKAGNALAIKCLLGVAAGGRQHLMAMQSQSGNNPTGLHLAAVSGHKDVVEILLALAPEPMQLCLAVNADGMAPLHCAARDGHEATARALLQRAPDGFHLLQMPMKNSSALRPLHLAAKHGHVEVVKCFLDFAPNPAALCVEASAGNTALHFAAAGGHTVVAQAILSYAGQSKELSDRATLLLTAVNRFDRQTALHVAADKGEKEVVETLLGAAPDRTALLQMSDKLGQTALHLAAEKGHGAVVHKLLTPADHVLVSARERITGQSALHMAAESGHTAAVRAILTASPYRETSLATDRGGRCTPLHLAAERGHLETVRTLVELCPDIDGLLLAQERFAGQTALHLAAGAGHAELCKVLLELAPNASTLLAAKDKSGGFTPLQLACEKGQTGVVETLLESDPDRGSRLKDTLEKWNGFSALHLVAYRGHEEAAKALLRLAPDRRALLALKDQKGRTPGDLAVDRGRRPVASLLSET